MKISLPVVTKIPAGKTKLFEKVFVQLVEYSVQTYVVFFFLEFAYRELSTPMNRPYELELIDVLLATVTALAFHVAHGLNRG